MAAASITPLTTDVTLGGGLPAGVSARFAAIWGTMLVTAALAAVAVAGTAAASLLPKSPSAPPATSLMPASTQVAARP